MSIRNAFVKILLGAMCVASSALFASVGDIIGNGSGTTGFSHGSRLPANANIGDAAAAMSAQIGSLLQVAGWFALIFGFICAFTGMLELQKAVRSEYHTEAEPEPTEVIEPLHTSLGDTDEISTIARCEQIIRHLARHPMQSVAGAVAELSEALELYRPVSNRQDGQDYIDFMASVKEASSYADNVGFRTGDKDPAKMVRALGEITAYMRSQQGAVSLAKA